MKYGDSTKAISTVIPTHNRKERLKQTLDALGSQTFDPKEIEVIVVADGCSDGTVDMLNTYHAPYRLQVLEQEGKGPGSARNQGAKVANGRILLFLDDDVVPTPNLIEEHVKTHSGNGSHVVIGYYPLARITKQDFLTIHLRAWWDKIFSSMFQRGHRYKYSNLLSGNFSLDRHTFKSAGGFNSDLRVHEDLELGIRLIKANIPFKFNDKALGIHHFEGTLEGLLERKFEEGQADVKIALLHPEVLPDLELSRIDSNSDLFLNLLSSMCFNIPEAAEVFASFISLRIGLLEKVKLRQAWRIIYLGLCDYYWFRGVAKEVTDKNSLEELIKPLRTNSTSVIPDLTLDLSKGVKYAEDLLNRERPSSAIINFGKHKIGIIPPEPCSEPLRGAHLRPILANEFSVPLLLALALEGEIISASEKECENLSNIIRLKSIYSGKPTPDKIWSDRHDQWQRLEGKKHDSISFWEIQEKIRELEHKKEWVESEWLKLKHQLEEKESIINKQRTIIRTPEMN